MKKLAIEVVGWYGTIVILGAYALVSFGLMQPKSLIFQLLNASGALGIAYICLKKKTYQPGVLNAIWAAIAIVAIVQLLV